ncbi:MULTISPECIES: hypothetical protein [Nostocales]|uniref:hypothetical protein n=1 Tax=Nostocales TaxID=1161 RepID=UPI001F3A02C7|nr:hypothetical protein [Nostoc sp. CMAA1605]MCF4968484.1 hypothetical protein [Nostoc sp. CMAA1605]
MIPTLIVAWIVFIIVWRILKATISNALMIAAILILLHIGFGITPQDIWQQIMRLIQTVSKLNLGN